jgi:molybdenum cofactor cytidylyltransferase
MGRPKMVLPWGDTTVIGRVVSVLVEAGLEQILVVTGGACHDVENALRGMPAQTIFNPRFSQGEMIESLQIGLENSAAEAQAALVALGDQPQIQVAVVCAVLQAYREQGARLVIPSFKMRRGHPWLVDRALWPQIMAVNSPDTLREFLDRFSEHIEYVEIDEESILHDLDTPSDYDRERPSG